MRYRYQTLADTTDHRDWSDRYHSHVLRIDRGGIIIWDGVSRAASGVVEAGGGYAGKEGEGAGD